MPAWQPDIIFYHDNCDDGFTAAWLARHTLLREALYFPINYGQPVPEMDMHGKNVLIADFSFTPEVLESFVNEHGAYSVVVLDHHKTAQAMLDKYNVGMMTANDVEAMLEVDPDERIYAWFDMNQSGAMLTHQFFFHGTPPSLLVKLVQDRDLWRFAIPDSRVISLWMRSYKRTWDQWSEMQYLLQNHYTQVLREARAIERFYRLKINEMHTLENLFVDIALEIDEAVHDAEAEIRKDERERCIKAADDVAERIMKNAEELHEEGRWDEYEELECQATAVTCAVNAIRGLDFTHQDQDGEK